MKSETGSERFDYEKYTHATYVVLSGRKVCNSGCGKDLGPA